MFLEKHRAVSMFIYLGHAMLFFMVGLVVGWAVAGEWTAGLQFGLSLLVWGVVLRTVYVWHITWAVNSLSHIFGYRNYETADGSRNNWIVAIITGGEGWHNNHHHDPSSASVQHRWWEFDLNFTSSKLLNGWVWPPTLYRGNIEETAKRRGGIAHAITEKRRAREIS